MSAPTFPSLIGQRVLVSVADGQPQMTTVRALAPQGQYVWLCAASSDDEDVGWRHVAHVGVLAVFGSATQTSTQLVATLAATIPTL